VESGDFSRPVSMARYKTWAWPDCALYELINIDTQIIKVAFPFPLSFVQLVIKTPRTKSFQNKNKKHQFVIVRVEFYDKATAQNQSLINIIYLYS
jgi:hypothetical protein